MGKNLLVGVNGTARKAKKIYLGIDGKARKVKKIYLGVEGKARLVYSESEPITGIVLTSYNQVSDGSYKMYDGFKCYIYSYQLAFKVTPSTAPNINVKVTSLLHDYKYSRTDEDDDGNDVTTTYYLDDCMDLSSSYSISSDGYVYVKIQVNSRHNHDFSLTDTNTEYKAIATIDICNTVDGKTQGSKFNYMASGSVYGTTLLMNYRIDGGYPYALG